MVDLKEIAEYQRNFDKKHGWDWSNSTDEEGIKHLQYGIIALTGEVGEFANIVKKILREFRSLGKLPGKEKIEMLKEELVDIFIYTIKIASQLLNMDLEKEYFKKMRINEEKFKKYKKVKK
jgi:NTP pyrophosphatase (non-canonical NTP hydrolase)